jgi:RimJ/RimL family protein N-acetyltransferase
VLGIVSISLGGAARKMAGRFPVLDEYASIRLGMGDQPDDNECTIVETERRNHRELSYGYIRIFWLLRYLNGKTVISVPPGCGEIAEGFVTGRGSQTVFPTEAEARELLEAVNERQRSKAKPQAERILWDKIFACSKETVRDVAFSNDNAELRRIACKGLTYSDDIWPPEHCIPDGVAYGVVADGVIVSVAYAHRTGIMEDRVADLGVVTSKPFRRRGYAKAAVHAITQHFTKKFGEAWYHCSPNNAASIATATSVGYVHCADSMILATTTPYQV